MIRSFVRFAWVSGLERHKKNVPANGGDVQMDFGLTLADTDVTDALTSFFSIGAVTAVLAAVIALRFVPRIAGALRGLMGRR